MFCPLINRGVCPYLCGFRGAFQVNPGFYISFHFIFRQLPFIHCFALVCVEKALGKEELGQGVDLNEEELAQDLQYSQLPGKPVRPEVVILQ